MLNIFDVLSYAVIVIVALFAVGLIFARLYRRASKEISFVRTGFGGQKVIMNGGALVFPVLHEVIPVNMNTLRLEVRRANEQALITRDRMRVDVLAEFYVRVKPTQDAIPNAAQTLGMRTMQPELLKELVEGKFVDALRAVAAEMAMTELHEQRVDFVQKVQQVVSEDLLKNGLELESVSLTGLDQTSREFFNPDNAFDAEGLTRLTQEIELRRKLRNEIEQDALVEIQKKNLEAEQQKLEIAKEEEYAVLKKEREVEIRRAAQNSDIATEQAAKMKEAEEAKIQAQKSIDLARITSERAIEEESIAMEQTLKEKNIEKERSVELAEQSRDIDIAEKSKSKSEAEADAAVARALAVQADEKVITAREKEVAERQKQIELIEAARVAERQAIAITTAAEAEKLAAEDQAEALMTLAQAESDKARVEAEGKAQAEKLIAEAAQVRYAVDADGASALNEASNLLSAEQIAMQVKMAIVKHMPDIIRESVKPMEQIDGIKIIQVDGLNAGGSAAAAGVGAGSGSESPGNLADQVVNSALKYRVQAPLIETLLGELGLEGSSLDGLAGGLTSQIGNKKDSA